MRRFEGACLSRIAGLLVAGPITLALAWPVPVSAAPWEFSAPVPVTAVQGDGLFHHLESAGRSNIAVSGERVAVVWEDNRSGTPQVYVALKPAGASAFDREYRVSAGKPAHEPAVAALGDGHFILGWEEDGQVWARVARPEGLDPARRLSTRPAGQIHLAVSAAGEVQAVWAERAGNFNRILTAVLKVTEGALEAGAAKPVDAALPRQDQLYPVAAWPQPGVLFVAWEDRRHGHTVLLYSRAAGQRFSPPSRLNERPPRRSPAYGRGSGVARVALARYGENGLAAVWTDKRDFQGGYDIYSALSPDAGRSFGRNRKVQDSFGDAFGQWHGAVAGNRAGDLAVVWDDDRDESADLWLAWPEAGGWSENLAVPGASGPGQQHNPAIALDDAGRLHLAWIAQQDSGPTRLMYLSARPTAGTKAAR